MDSSTSKIRVLTVDDSKGWRDSIRQIVCRQSGIKFVGEESGGQEGLQIASELKPGWILIDIGLPQADLIQTHTRDPAGNVETLYFKKREFWPSYPLFPQ